MPEHEASQEIQRWTISRDLPDGLDPDSFGNLVKYDDHLAALSRQRQEMLREVREVLNAEGKKMRDEVERHHHVLEPSAGRGAIAHRLAEIVPADRLHMVELQAEHAAHLPLGNRINADYMGWTPPRLFDRVVMNPPFERDQDIRHVLHAYGMLAPGGVLVAVMGAGAETRRHRHGLDFRELLASGHVEANPDNSFREAGTNVRTITVRLTRPTQEPTR